MHRAHIPFKYTHNRAHRLCTLLTGHTGIYKFTTGRHKPCTKKFRAWGSQACGTYKLRIGQTWPCAQSLHPYNAKLVAYLAQVTGHSPHSCDQVRKHIVACTMEDSLQSLLPVLCQLNLCILEGIQYDNIKRVYMNLGLYWQLVTHALILQSTLQRVSLNQNQNEIQNMKFHWKWQFISCASNGCCRRVVAVAA